MENGLTFSKMRFSNIEVYSISRHLFPEYYEYQKTRIFVWKVYA